MKLSFSKAHEDDLLASFCASPKEISKHYLAAAASKQAQHSRQEAFDNFSFHLFAKAESRLKSQQLSLTHCEKGN